MANWQRLLRQVLGFVRKNPDKANRHLRTAGETVKRRTGGKYDRHIDKATGMAAKYLGRQGGRDRRHDRGGYGGGPPKHRPDGYDDRR
ncbi:antitoxin protein of toxin-antitoxin system [Murinocardiopsis flavida]|uniref:Antitoxin protein of toxin-antitoxin system n=1 Tax=Murinocardiopsis flavida TaxID=645275 RepID=A0A2P8DUB3_9ACTN|nr:antitoxin [Murinocardiopsis flavida]PSL00810.1 antitoxin protein of toxin-antitoxin system [Murinocardiopsis flavida]